MKRAVIIANGRMEKPHQVAPIIQSSDLIIAANGGIHNCESLGIRPHAIIGDLDSMTASEVSAHQAAGVEITRYSTHKDETDLELALHFAMKNEIDEVDILGALGERWDMTIANLLLIAQHSFSGMKIRILDGTQELLLLRAGEPLLLSGRIGDTLSLIPMQGDVRGITTRGLEYPLNNETLHFGSPRGVSNTIANQHAEVFFEEGLLLCVLAKQVK